MERLREMQLSLCREACRHIDLAESISDLADAIDPFVPLDSMWVFAVEADRCVMAASLTDAPMKGDGAKIEGEDAGCLWRFVQRGGLAPLNPAKPGRSLVRSLIPWVGPSAVICGALQRTGQSEGIVVWRLSMDSEPSERVLMLLAGTLEPLAVALDTSRRFQELEALKRTAEADRQAALRRLGRQSLTAPIVGADVGLRDVMERVGMVAASDVPVLILGETGSGKEVIARAIHDRSARHDGPFVRVNCGAIPPELVDSQLFGHEKGAFTGAVDQRQGWFERADGGTLLLDEVGELPPAAQVRLLRVLQDGSLERVGGQRVIHVDCRIVAATHRDLAEMVRQRTFRQDLWYRLAVFPLMIPPLRERRGDLKALAQHFARRAATRFGLTEFEVQDSDVDLLARYRWPGNIRELATVIDRAALLGQGRRLALAAAMGTPAQLRHLPGEDSRSENATEQVRPAWLSLENAIRAHIERSLRYANGKIEGPGGAAELLCINPQTLRSKMKRLGIQWATYRRRPAADVSLDSIQDVSGPAELTFS